MTREERIEICRICKNRKMDLSQGLLCNVTNKKADFDKNCETFDKDYKEDTYLLYRKLAGAGKNTVGDASNFKKNQDFGVAFFIIGAFLTYILINSHFSKPPIGLAIYGAYLYIRGIEQEKIYNDHIKKNKDEISN